MNAMTLKSDRPLRILNVNQNYHVLGGMDVAMFRLEELMRSHGHVVIPFAAADPSNRPTEYARYFPPASPTADSTPADLLRTLYSPAARRAIGRVLDEQRIEIVHLHSYFKRLTPAILPEIARRGIPIVQTMHEYRAVCPISLLYRDGHLCTDCRGRRYSQAIRHRCAAGSLARSVWNVAEMRLSDTLGHKRHIARYLSISEYQREQLIAMGLPADRVETIYHPVPLAAPPIDLDLVGPVLFAGRVEPHKGIFWLIEAARRLPHVPFVVAGDGSARAEAMERSGDLANIAWLGVLDAAALAEQRSRALCAVVPSLYPEPFGLTSIEALAHGLPAIVASNGGLAETVRDGVDGFQVASNDVDQLIDRITLLAASPERARIMGKAGQARVATEFSADNHYRRTMVVYRQVLSPPRSVAA